MVKISEVHTIHIHFLFKPNLQMFFFSFETFSCMQILSLIAIQMGFVKLFWLSASHLLSNHVENLQVDLFWIKKLFFFLVRGN